MKHVSSANPFPREKTLAKVFEFAQHCHWGQKRKDGLPYIVHPIAVAKMLRKAGYGDEVVAAGFLHDVLEDTGCELEDLEKRFGKKITKIVVEVTDKDKTVRWKKRKLNYLNNLKKASRAALAVACADKADNIESFLLAYEKEGERFRSLFGGKAKERIKNYENIFFLIQTRYPSCPLLEAYQGRLARMKTLFKF